MSPNRSPSPPYSRLPGFCLPFRRQKVIGRRSFLSTSVLATCVLLFTIAFLTTGSLYRHLVSVGQRAIDKDYFRGTPPAAAPPPPRIR